jgi:hypothetical protein
MVCCGLKTMDKLNAKEEKEKQIEFMHTSKAAATLSNALVLSLTKTNPFASLEVLLLPPKV